MDDHDINTTAELLIEESDDENEDDDLNNTQQLMNNINTQHTNDTDIKSDYDEYDEDEEELPLKNIITMLRISWQNEKLAPEILEYEQSFVDRVKDAIDRKEEKVDEMEMDIQENIHNMDNKILSASIYWYKKEIQRIKYILNSYLRIRIWKIQKYITHMLSDEDAYNKLSPQEQKFAKKYSDLNENHFKTCFLRELPSKYRSMTDPEMCVKPNLNEFVVMKANDNNDNILIEDGKQHINLQKGNIFVARYKNFKHLIPNGNVDLI